MAHTKSQKAAKGNRDSVAKRLGVKLYGGQKAKAGSVIVRQRGMKFAPGVGTYMGRDFTIHAEKPGVVQFITKRGKQHITIQQPSK